MARDQEDGTVGKALAVLDQVAAFGHPVRFSEILSKSSFPKPTLYRLVQTLTNQGMLSFDPDRQTYAPGVRLVRLAHAAWAQSTLAPVARPHLDALSAQVGETVHLAQLDNAQVLYLEKRNAIKPVAMYSQAGKVGPAYCTGVGKVMLAYTSEPELDRLIAQQSFHAFTPSTLTTPDALMAELDNIVARGYGFDREEHEPGIICIAVPILTEKGRPIGALSVTSTSERQSLKKLEGWADTLQQTARDIAYDAANWHIKDQD